MNHITQSEYFFWGSACPDQYALYSPALNRFILVDSVDGCLEHVCFIMSSKIDLSIVPLHAATNFEHNLVDNSCCVDWGVEKWRCNAQLLTPPLLSRRTSCYLDACETLKQYPTAPSHVHQLQQFALLTVYAVRIFQSTQQTMHKKFYHVISSPFPVVAFDRILALEKQCYELLYLADDFDTVAQQIKPLISDFTEVSTTYA